MTLTPRTALILLIGFSSAMAEDTMNMTIKGQSSEKPPLEVLLASTAIPPIRSLKFSDDDGASAASQKIEAVTLGLEKSPIPLTQLPLIPTSPFLMQPRPLQDDPLMNQMKPFGTLMRKTPDIASWEYAVRDESGNTVYQSSGMGPAPHNLMWDGTADGKFIFDPNRIYSSHIIYHSTINTSATFVGEAERYLAVSYKEETDEIIIFSERVFAHDSSQFSPEGQFYLNDLLTRIQKAIRQQPSGSRPIEINIYDTRDNKSKGLTERRKAAWMALLKNTLPLSLSENIFTIPPLNVENTLIVCRIKNFQDSQRPLMVGLARDPRPQFEEPSSWIQQKEIRGNLMIELRHDRLFKVGTAYLRDQAVPLILEKIKLMKEEKQRNPRRLIILRSLIHKPLNGKESKTVEEDPKLDALRSKVLFMLLAEARYGN